MIDSVRSMAMSFARALRGSAGYSGVGLERQLPWLPQQRTSRGPEIMQRVVVIGNSGGGKSVLARRIVARFALPYVEIDRVLWRKGWRLAPEAEYRAEHERIIAQDRWVIDGLGRQDSVAARVARATDIVLIDLPLWVHFWLAAERQIAWAEGSVGDPPAGISEMPPTKGLFETIWEVEHNWLPQLRELATAAEADGKTVVHLKSLEELDAFTARL
jgi:hypothetical protein